MDKVTKWGKWHALGRRTSDDPPSANCDARHDPRPRGAGGGCRRPPRRDACVRQGSRNVCVWCIRQTGMFEHRT